LIPPEFLKYWTQERKACNLANGIDILNPWEINIRRRTMFVIRNEQMEAFRAAFIGEFENRMLRHLRSVFPDQTLSINDQRLHELIRSGIDNSKKYGMKMEGDIRRYLECSVSYGWDYDTDPNFRWAGEILHDEGMDGETKMDIIEQHEAEL
jgi:hypothetical protein